MLLLLPTSDYNFCFYWHVCARACLCVCVLVTCLYALPAEQQSRSPCMVVWAKKKFQAFLLGSTVSTNHLHYIEFLFILLSSQLRDCQERQLLAADFKRTSGGENVFKTVGCRSVAIERRGCLPSMLNKSPVTSSYTSRWIFLLT